MLSTFLSRRVHIYFANTLWISFRFRSTTEIMLKGATDMRCTWAIINFVCMCPSLLPTRKKWAEILTYFFLENYISSDMYQYRVNIFGRCKSLHIIVDAFWTVQILNKIKSTCSWRTRSKSNSTFYEFESILWSRFRIKVLWKLKTVFALIVLMTANILFCLPTAELTLTILKTKKASFDSRYSQFSSNSRNSSLLSVIIPDSSLFNPANFLIYITHYVKTIIK